MARAAFFRIDIFMHIRCMWDAGCTPNDSTMIDAAVLANAVVAMYHHLDGVKRWCNDEIDCERIQLAYGMS